jgi:ligand-binding SRPBCC domain-containing protein
MTRMHRLVRTQRVEAPLDEVFAFFSEAENLDLLTPPFLRFRILTPTPIAMRPDARIEYALSLFGVPLRWRTRITVWESGVRFVDEQESGPYARWVHTHTFEPVDGGTIITDRVDYALPFGPLGALAHATFVERTLARIFDFRRDATARRFGGHGARSAATGAEPAERQRQVASP